MTTPVLKQENVLVDVCPEDKDKYRFGFNGQEKVNEWSGIRNHNTAMFWEYDTRTGQRLDKDPIVKPWESSYSTFSRSPIWKIDPDGNTDYFNQRGSLIYRDEKTRGDGKVVVVTNSGIARDLERGRTTLEMLNPKDQFELPPYDHRQEIKRIVGTVYSKPRNERDYEVGGRGFKNDEGKLIHVRSQDGERGKSNDGRGARGIRQVAHSEDKWKMETIFNDPEYDWHFHPASTATEGFNPEPSIWDIEGAKESNSQFVISDESDKVYFYNKNTTVETPPQGGDGYGSDGVSTPILEQLNTLQN